MGLVVFLVGCTGSPEPAVDVIVDSEESTDAGVEDRTWMVVCRSPIAESVSL
jgi:hypothetical protein